MDNLVLFLYGNINDLKDLNQDISLFRKEKANKYKYEDDKKRCILSELLLKEGLKEFEIKDHDIEYSFNKYGKPYLKNHKDIYFNFSHSGEFVVCVLANFEIGVDIEKIEKADLNIAEKFFHKNEYQHILNSNKPNDDFYRIWTYKESYTKALGKGLALDLNTFDVTNIKDYVFKEVEFIDDYKCVICGKNDFVVKFINL